MSEVVDLNSRRTTATDEEVAEDPLERPIGCPDCGGTWFRLIPQKLIDGTTLPGTVGVTEAGGVFAWSGGLVCNLCFTEIDQDWTT